MTDLNVVEAKSRFSEVLARAAAGEQFVIHRRSRPLAVLVSSAEWERLQRTAALGSHLAQALGQDPALLAAVADGTVVYAAWMTGYGNILIIDHGNGYMSLYAHNDGLLRDAGDTVKRGDTVASVGTSGGQDSPALYFELRRNGSPVNPASWLTRQ